MLLRHPAVPEVGIGLGLEPIDRDANLNLEIGPGGEVGSDNRLQLLRRREVRIDANDSCPEAGAALPDPTSGGLLSRAGAVRA